MSASSKVTCFKMCLVIVSTTGKHEFVGHMVMILGRAEGQRLQFGDTIGEIATETKNCLSEITAHFSLVFIPYISDVLEGKKPNNMHRLYHSFIYFYVLAPTCFGSSLPSSGSLLDPSELLENTN
jgi:hypothetical protein